MVTFITFSAFCLVSLILWHVCTLGGGICESFADWLFGLVSSLVVTLLMSWDLFLDPQMVGEGYWTWTTVGWQLPGIPGIPLQNFLGWWLAGMLLMFLLDRLPRKTANDSAPNTLLLWTYASNVLGAVVFFDRPAVAIWGGVAMGIVIIPWAWRLWSQPEW